MSGAENNAVLRLLPEQRSDVLVVGCGLAGVTAAIAAAENGARVTLLSAGAVFSGSSFYPGTWGLGLIAPESDADRQDLMETILTVGCGMVEPTLVRTLVDGIGTAIKALRADGVRLLRAEHAGQREFIPCFDHKARDWNGIAFDSARSVFSARLTALNIRVVPHCEVLELVRAQGRVCGAIAAHEGVLHYFGCGALVLATGGCGGLFRERLTTGDVTGCGQALALRAGARLTNLEFFQIMPGYLSPAKNTIFNEKTFRFASLWAGNAPLLPENTHTDDLLAERATHGPFTTRLSSAAVDLAIFRACLTHPEGVTVRYSQAMKDAPPEFIRTYFDWLRREKGLSWDDPVQIGLFAHASNGGIVIDARAATGVPGLFACGEATGGMHGADRIGGLSTANALVFGGIAGREAARDAAAAPRCPDRAAFDAWTSARAGQAQEQLRAMMSRYALLARSEEGLAEARNTLRTAADGLTRTPAETIAQTVLAHRVDAQLLTADALLSAALLRRESRGSHHRIDYPAPKAALAERIEIALKQGDVTVRFAGN